MIATDRVVYTHMDGRWPVGIITGRPLHGGFAIEHVVAFKRSALRPMIRAGLDLAWSLDYEHLSFAMPDDFALRGQLLRLAARLGFKEYARHGSVSWFWLKRPA